MKVSVFGKSNHTVNRIIPALKKIPETDILLVTDDTIEPSSFDTEQISYKNFLQNNLDFEIFTEEIKIEVAWQQIIYDIYKVKFHLSGLHFNDDFRRYFSTYQVLDFDYEKPLGEDSFKLSKEVYNISTAFNIIEHMEYPNKLLDNINYFTKKDGSPIEEDKS